MASDPVDFRKGHDGLAALVQSQLRQKPFDGSVYVFRAKRADRLKLIYWDGSGLVMAYKRLEDNSFTWPAIKNGVMRLRGPFEQTVISSIAIDLQGAAEALQDIVRILAGSPRRIGEGHAGRILTAPWPVIPGQGPEVACFGAFASRSQNRCGRFIHEEFGGALQVGHPRALACPKSCPCLGQIPNRRGAEIHCQILGWPLPVPRRRPHRTR